MSDNPPPPRPREHAPGAPPDSDFLGPSYWMSPDEVRASFNEEDERWSSRAQLVDWLILLGLMVLFGAWTLTVYFLEPGLR